MNKEILRGIVLRKIGEKRYLVKILKESGSCSSCGFSKFCKLGNVKDGEDIIEATGDDLVPGDEVICEEKVSGIIAATALIFLVPIIAFVLGYYIGVYFKLSESLSSIAGLIFVAIYFLFLRLFDKKLAESLFKFEVRRRS